MSYIDKVLQPGEVVLNRTRLHWFIYLRPALVIALAVILLIAAVVVGGGAEFYLEIAAAAVCLFGLLRLFVAWLTRWSTELAVTDRRIIHKTGFFSRNTHEMNREKVESVDVKQSLSGRVFGYGTILVRGVGSTWEPFGHIADPLAFRSTIIAG